MNRIVIDTNIVISFLTNRNLEQQELAAKLFIDASADRSLRNRLKALGVIPYPFSQ
jgi:hypothetical protein